MYYLFTHKIARYLLECLGRICIAGLALRAYALLGLIILNFFMFLRTWRSCATNSAMFGGLYMKQLSIALSIYIFYIKCADTIRSTRKIDNCGVYRYFLVGVTNVNRPEIWCMSHHCE